MYLEVTTVKSARVPGTGGYPCFTSRRERRKGRRGGAGERRRGVNLTFLWWRILTEYYVERGIRDKIEGVCFQENGANRNGEMDCVGTNGRCSF